MHESLPAQGDIVWIRQARWRVDHAHRFRTVVRLDVSNRHRRCTFLSPFDRWSIASSPNGMRVVRPQRARAQLAALVARCGSLRIPSSALHANISILPYQLEPALAFGRGARRILIADEVGLGKTIQAGLAIAELVRRDPAARVLVVAPASLGDQWRTELAARFQIDSTIADADALNRVARSGARGDNPWRRPGVWIASPDYLKQPHVADALPWQPWDLVAIDEAHGVSGQSERHRACHDIARRSRRVVLMSATPHNGDETGFTRLCNLGRLDGIDDPLVAFRRTRDDVGLSRTRRIRWRRVRPSADERRVLDALLAFERAVLRAAGSRRHEAALLLLSVLRKRALSTMAALVSSLDRRLAWLDAPERATSESDWLQPRLAFDDSSDDIGDDEHAALRADVGLSTGHERSWLRRLLLLAHAAQRHDSKVLHLARLVRRAREPVVIFTEFRDSLDVVRRAIEGTGTTAVLHGGMNPAERRQALEQFLCGGATALVATDVASQGLNLHEGARWVVNLELPWNPARLEQRVGRVDRIGQTRPVHATMLVTDHAAESAVLARLARRALAARRALGADVFGGAVPDAARLRACVLSGAALDLDASGAEPPRPHVLVCRRWERPARFVARQLSRRRRLAWHWRGRPSQGRRTIWASGGSRPRLLGHAKGPLLIFAASIVDRSGVVIEQHAVAVLAAGASCPTEGDRSLIDCARKVAARRMAGRVSRLTRLFREQCGRESALEHAIGAVIAAARRAALPQPGLFDPRWERPVDSDPGADPVTEIRVGPVTLAVVIGGRP